MQIGIGIGLPNRSGVNPVPAFAPSDISGLLAWWKGDAGVLNGSDLPAANGENVKVWQDQSGNARHLQQPTSGSRPLYNSALFNKPVINFEDTPGDFLLTAAAQPVSFAPYTVFLLWRPKTGLNNASIVLNTSSTTLGSFFIEGTGTNTMYLNAGASALGSAYTLDTFAYSTAVFNGASSKHYKDGTLIGTGNPGNRAMGGFCLGAYITGGDPAEMYVYEVIVFNSEISGTNLTNMHSYLASRIPA